MTNSTVKFRWSLAPVVGIVLLVLAAFAMVHSKSISISPGWDDLNTRFFKWQMLNCSYLLFGIAVLLGGIVLAKHGFCNALSNTLQLAIVVAVGAYVLFYVFWPTTDMLVASVANNDIERAKYCLGWGVDVDQRVTFSVDHLYESPLSVAVFQENLGMVELLLAAGANPKWTGGGQRLFPLTQSWEIRDRLLAAGESIDAESGGSSFLEHAIKYSVHRDTGPADSQRRWQEVQEFLTRGATITEGVRKAALVDLELARRIETHLVKNGHRDTEPRWVLFRGLLLEKEDVVLKLLETEPRLSEFPKSSDLILAVRCDANSTLSEWLPRIETTHKYRSQSVVEMLESAAAIATRNGSQEMVELLMESATTIRESQLIQPN